MHPDQFKYRFTGFYFLVKHLPEETALQCREKAHYAYNVGLIDDAFRLYAIAYRF